MRGGVGGLVVVVLACWVGRIGSSLSLFLLFPPSLLILNAKGTHKKGSSVFLKVNFKMYSLCIIKCTHFKCTFDEFWQMTYLYDYHQDYYIEYFQHLKSCLVPHCRKSLTPNPSPRQPLICCQCRLDFSFLLSHKNGVLHYVHTHWIFFFV